MQSNRKRDLIPFGGCSLHSVGRLLRSHPVSELGGRRAEDLPLLWPCLALPELWGGHPILRTSHFSYINT